MNFLQRFMYGRYGMDQLNTALLLGYLVLYLVSALFRGRWLSFLSFLCLAAVAVRFFSRNLERRREENARFLNAVDPLLRRYNVNKSRRQDRDHCYFKCPNCGQQLRVPKGKDKISVTCRNCGVSFEEKT